MIIMKKMLAQSLSEIHSANLTPVDLVCGIGLTLQGRNKDESLPWIHDK